jgi:hypothetical protein
VPVLLAVAYALGWLLAGALRLAWWLLRAVWWVTWRVVVLSAALLLLAFSRSLAWRLAVLGLGAALSGRVVRRGGWGGKSPSTEHRTTSTQGAAPVRLKPVSAQAVATATYAATRWHTRGLDGPGLLTMLIGPAATGKSELVWGTLRAALDGEAFCGLETARPRRVLLLSEMGGETLAPALQRWGFYVEPSGRLDGLRLRLLAPRGAVGAPLEVVYAADVYKPVVGPDGELRQVEWPAVVQAAGALCARRGYDRLIVDSLGEWMGADNNEALLRTLGACRQLTHAGIGVTILHHTPRSDPKRPRGGTVIEAKLDVGYSVTGLGPGGAPRSRQDPVRSLEWFKTRFPEQTPAQALLLERVWAGPDSGERPRYQLRDALAAAQNTGGVSMLTAPDLDQEPPPTLTPQVRQVLEALRAAGRAGATTTQLAEATGLNRGRAHEALIALIKAGEARPGGTGERPAGGGRAPGLYVATGLTQGDRDEQDGGDRRRGHLRLLAPEESA